MRFLSAICLSLMPLYGYGEAQYVLVGYVCDQAKNELRLTYDPVSDDASFKKKRQTQWNPWSLIAMKDDDHIKSLKTIRRRCHLSDGAYDISLFPQPGNFNVQGRCGAWMTAGATVQKGQKILYTIDGFERACDDDQTPVITRVIVRPGSRDTQITKTSQEDFQK